MSDIDLYNYWEHYKAAKDLALILPIDHPKRIAIESQLSELSKKLNNQVLKQQ